MAEYEENNIIEEEETSEEMSDDEFESWLTFSNEFSNDYYRQDDTMQKMLIMTKISQAHLDKELVDEHMDVIVDLIKTNLKDLIGKHFKIVYIESEADLQLYVNVLFRKGKIALIGAR